MDVLNEFLLIAAEVLQKKDKPLPFPKEWGIIKGRRDKDGEYT